MTASVPEASNQGIEPRKAKATFPSNARLLRHADFERVYKQGRRHFSASMTVFYLDRRGVEAQRRLRRPACGSASLLAALLEGRSSAIA